MHRNKRHLPHYASRVLPLRERLKVRNGWLKQRLETVIPELLARENVDIWLVIAREYNEDPVIMSMLPEPAMAARRRTILAFCRNADGSVDRYSLDRYGHGEFYQAAWKPEEEAQYERLARLIMDRDPATIAINTSADFAFGDGLTETEYRNLVDAIGLQYAARLCSAERLCVGWLERRIEPELTAYPAIVALGHALIAEAFSEQVIHPGITTSDDVVWWMRQRMLDIGVQAWFQPTIEIQAPGQHYDQKTDRRSVILPGDLLHCDVGFYYLGLATDQQQHAYILKPGETDAPAGLKAALAEGNRLQDIHMAAMAVGRTGNAVLQAALEQARAEDLNPMIYSHPLGYHGHAAGPTIGLWDQQDGVPGRGDYPVFDNTCYSIELCIKKAVPEWDGQEVRIALEEDAVLHNGAMRWLHGRQTEFYLIGE